MVDQIPPIQGPGSPSHSGEAARRQERTAADADKFKQELRRKQSQVSESDAEQQKKRKQQAEEEEDDLPETQEPTQPTTSFEGKDLEPSPLSVKGGTSPLASAQTAPSAPSPYQTPLPVATPAPAAEDVPASQTSTTPPPTTPLQSTSTPQTLSTTPSSPQTQETSPAPPTSSQASKEDTQKQQGQDQDATPAPAPPTSGTPSPSEEIAPSSEEALPPEGEELALSPPPPPPALPPPQATTSEEVMEELVEGMTQPTPSSGSESKGDSSQQEKKREAPSTSSPFGGGMGAPVSPFVISTDTSTPPLPTPYSNLSSEMLDVFEQMVGLLTVMSDSKMSETKITLTSPKFASSIFYGTQIIIKESSSARGVFNIELNSNPEAVKLFDKNVDALMAAFQNPKYQFRVHRIDTGILVRRKEKISEDSQEHPPEQND